MVEQDKKQMTLLEENIKTKGENAYYYAHKRIVDDRENGGNVSGKIISGPGIITGGDPVLLEVVNKPVEIIKENKKFIKYIFMDDDEMATVKIDFPDELKNLVKIEHVECKFGERSLDVKVSVDGKDPYYLCVKKLHKKIVPEECKYKLSKNLDKLIINLKKKETESEWEKLTD